MTFIPRAAWGARKGGSLSALNVDTVTIHWGGGPLGALPQSAYAGVVRSYQNYHLDGQGWADIAYNLLVDPFGNIYEGRGLGKRSAANGDTGPNSASYAICYIGGTGDPLTSAGKDGINEAAEMLVPAAGRKWKLHGDWVQTDCPGTVIRDWVRRGHPRSTPDTPQPTEVPTLIVFDYPEETGVWISDGITRRPTNAPQKYLNAGVAKHIGTLTKGEFNELRDGREDATKAFTAEVAVNIVKSVVANLSSAPGGVDPDALAAEILSAIAARLAK